MWVERIAVRGEGGHLFFSKVRETPLKGHGNGYMEMDTFPSWKVMKKSWNFVFEFVWEP